MPWIKLMLPSRLHPSRLTAFGLCGYLFIVLACSSANSDAPAPGEVHEARYMLNHSVEAAADSDQCKKCHGSELMGKNQISGCFNCHENSMPITLHPIPYSDPDSHGAAACIDQSKCLGCHGSEPNVFDGGVLSDPGMFNSGATNCSAAECHPAAGAHPTSWQGENDITGDHISSHRSTTTETIQKSCALCHQVYDGGSKPLPKAPSCFSAGFTNSDNSTTGCHPGGFTPDHGVPYTDPNDHGVAAGADLASCQTCHGEPGTINFNGGTAPTGCSTQACHPDAGAHPTNWAGNDNSGYNANHINAGRKSATCIICHDVTQGRTAPNVAAPSCFSDRFQNGNGLTTGCHPSGAVPDHGLPYTDSNDHGVPAKADLADCQTCHGEPGTINFDGGSAPTGCSTQACHPYAGAHPTTWRNGHRSADRTDTTCIICHDVTEGRTAPNTKAPSCFSRDFTNSNGINGACHPGGMVPTHGLPYTDPTDHGSPAKSNLTDCQACHGDPGTINFNGGSAPTGCASCHTDAGAHPTNWAANDSSGYISTHANASRTTSTCIVCHDVTQGRTAPNNAAPSCFSDRFQNGNGLTTGCHPSGIAPDHVLPFTNPNDHGDPARSDLGDCQNCHGDPGTTRFNGGSASTACESCHVDANAHPTSWRSGHRGANRMSSTCTLCHDYYNGDPSPHNNAPSCYAGSWNGRSCHSDGP